MLNQSVAFVGERDFGFAVFIPQGSDEVHLTTVAGGQNNSIRPVNASWFDDKQTASGVYNASRDKIVSLPLHGMGEPRTNGSPLPRLPWGTRVKISVFQITEDGIVRVKDYGAYPLGDIGPAHGLIPPRAIDLSRPVLDELGLDPAIGIYKVYVSIPGIAEQVIALAETRGWRPSTDDNTPVDGN